MLGKAIDNFLGDVAIISAESKLDAVVNEEVVSFDDTDLRKNTSSCGSLRNKERISD